MRTIVENVSKSYGRLRALDGVSLSVEPGQIVAVLGPNGAGKTTLLRCLAGIVAPDRGRILYDNEVFRRGRVDLRRRFAFLPDVPVVFHHLTVLRHIGMALRLYERDTEGLEERVLQLLRDFDLLTMVDTPFFGLSRGQAYKGALAAIMAVDPEVWLLDEPFASGMDPNGITMFKRHAREAARQGRSILYSTQILDIAEVFSDRRTSERRVELERCRVRSGCGHDHGVSHCASLFERLHDASHR